MDTNPDINTGTVVTVVDLSKLADEHLEPSEEFARLLMRIGHRAGIGVLGLSAIRTLVRRRAGRE